MYVWSRESENGRLGPYLMIVLPLVFLLGLGWPWHGLAASAPMTLQEVLQAGRVTLGAGESLILLVTDMVRVAVAEPKIADVAAVGRNEVLVSARTVGETTLHIWDKGGLSSFAVRVQENTKDLVSELKSRMALPGVNPWMHQGTVVLEGSVQSPAERQRANQVAAAYGKVVDLLTIVPPTVPTTAETVDDGGDQRLTELRALIDDPSVQLQVVNGTLLITGTLNDAQAQERMRKVAALYYPEVVDVSQVRSVGSGSWNVEVYRVVEKSVVQVDK